MSYILGYCFVVWVSTMPSVIIGEWASNQVETASVPVGVAAGIASWFVGGALIVLLIDRFERWGL